MGHHLLHDHRPGDTVDAEFLFSETDSKNTPREYVHVIGSSDLANLAWINAICAKRPPCVSAETAITADTLRPPVEATSKISHQQQ